MADKDQKQSEKLSTLEIKPSEEYRERPMWQRVAAFIMIGLIVAGTVACAFWKFI